MSEWDWSRHLYSTYFLINLHNEGYLRPIDYLDVYSSDYCFSTAKESYQREIADLESALGVGSPPSQSLTQVYALFLRSAGNYHEASTIQEESLRNLESNLELGIEYVDTQNLMSDLAETYRLQGRFEESSRYCHTVRMQRVKIFGQDHPLVLACLHMEARTLQGMGSDKESEQMYRDVISKLESSLGKYHEGTLNAMNNLGTLYMAQTRYGEALTLVEEAMQCTERLLGPTHHSTLMSLINLAAVHAENGDLCKAQSLLHMTTVRLRLTLGDDHPMTCAVYANCGALYLKLGRHEESMTYFSEALTRMEILLGCDHPNTLMVARSKATALDQLGGDYEEINALFRKCLQVHERVLGEDHPETLTTLQEYSFFLFQRERYEEAEKSYRSLLLRQEKRFGSDHIALVEPLSNLGEILARLKLDGEEELYRRALTLATKFDRGDTDISGDCMWNLATYLLRYGLHLDEAETLYRRIIDLRELTSSETPADRYQALEDVPEVLLIDLLLDQGRLEEAEEVQRKLVDLSGSILTEEDPERLGVRATLAWILNKVGKFSEAEGVYLECIGISTDAVGEGDEQTLDLSAKLAWNMEQGGKSKEAQVRILEVLQKAKDYHSALHPVYLRVAAIAAGIHFRQADHVTAINLSCEVVEGSNSIFGAESEEARVAKLNHAGYTKEA